MKNILLITTLILTTSSAFAGWTENFQCMIRRTSIDTRETKSQMVTGKFVLDGPHNGETGKFEVTNTLTPSYRTEFVKVSDGITDHVEMTTYRGTDVVAKSSVDNQQDKTVENKFLTKQITYQVVVSCSSDVVQ